MSDPPDPENNETESVASGGALGWRSSGNNSNAKGPEANGENDGLWRRAGTSDRFLRGVYGKRSSSRNPGEQWRGSTNENRFFGARSSGNSNVKETNWRTPRKPNTSPVRKSAADHDGQKPYQPRSQKALSRPLPKNPVEFKVPELLEMETNELVQFLVENLSNFNDFLTSSLSPNTVTELVFVLEKVCSPKADRKLVEVILSRICKKFAKQLDLYLVKLSLDEEDDKGNTPAFWKDPDAFWNSLVVLFRSIANRFPALAKEVLPKVIKASLITIEFHKNSHGIYVEQDIKRELEALTTLLKNLRKITEQDDADYPDDSYQYINVYPDPIEVLTPVRPRIRRNVVEGNYKSVEQYLDTHFWLLREDFLAPLRDAISTYKDDLKNRKHTKITEFRIYTSAEFVKMKLPYICNVDDYDLLATTELWSKSIRISYFTKIIRQRTYKLLCPDRSGKEWRNTDDCFMSGSLLCFSSDSFETMFFGTVVRVHGTFEGYINVQLLENVPFLYDQSFVMLECTNYFGTCYSVLKALQNIDQNQFPMENYIVKVETANKPPKYLQKSTKYTTENHQFTVLDFQSWPSKEELNLNEKQYEAFKHALTSEFAMIQGPPGTGKTHLGLKITQTLIENLSKWGGPTYSDEYVDDADEDDGYTRYRLTSVRSSGPILIVAYTNHALDQFLEGLLPFTSDIVRLGQQCKNEALSEFVFSGSRLHRRVLFNYYYDIEDTLVKNENLMEELESVLTYSGILDIKIFSRVISNFQMGSMMSRDEIVFWLMGNSSTKQQRQKRWELTKEITDDRNNEHMVVKNSFYEARYILTISALKSLSKQLEDQLAFKDAIFVKTMFKDWSHLEQRYEQTVDDLAYLKWRLQNAEAHTSLYEEREMPEDDLFQLSYNDRWILYFHWVDLYVQHLQDALERNRLVLNGIWEQMELEKQEAACDVLSRAVVVGMTTSCAARYQHLLTNLNCRIVIVEEAAEVLEAHIVTALAPDCQHLILIGDHQQLRPSTADYRIEKQYQLGISLFERMVRNGVSCSTLEVQHRMRPEISELIAPSIYPSLKNHSSVFDFSSIGGVIHDVFFISHEHPEVEFRNSRINPHEAQYVIALARHLILQGYEPSQITILSTYKGQMHEIQNLLSRDTFEPLQNVRVTVVDNFQGEENEIILLSLVRSNNQNSIGFLAIENRVCVALSRAKKGFYMIGNIKILIENSKIWPKVKEVLDRSGRVGRGLQLACQLHPENVLVASEPEDFQKIPDGGCSLACGATISCGHTCQRKCHVTDRKHEAYRCMEPCTKVLCTLDHICPKRCWQPCDSCQVPMEQLLPCEHLQMVPCSMKIEEYKCPTVLETLLSCGHLVQKPCFGNPYEKCPVEVEAMRPSCGHIIKKKCFEDVAQITCKMTVTVARSCGHSSETKCVYKKDASVCRKRCSKILECGHTCKKDCHYNDRDHSTKEYACKDKCSKFRIGCKNYHQCSLLCSEPCESCTDDVIVELPCGHSLTVECGKSDGEYACENYCRKTKPCGHTCYSKCHTECNSLCPFKVSKQFPKCGHKIKINCSEALDGKNCIKCVKNVKKVV